MRITAHNPARPQLQWALQLLSALAPAVMIFGSAACDESDAGSVDSVDSVEECSCFAPRDGGRFDVDARAADDAGRDGKPLAEAAAPNPSTGISFVPIDLTTSVGTKQLGLSVYSYSPLRTQHEVLDELASALELVTWPAAQRVAADIQVDAGAPPYATQVLLQPRQALVDGWYALRLNPQPANVRFGTVGSATRDGIPMARFRVGSEPLVQRVELCAKSDDQTKIVVTTSEPVRAAQPNAGNLMVTVDSTPAPCGAIEFAQALGAISSFSSLCTIGPSATSLEIRVPSLVGMSGVPLTDGAGASPSYVIAPATLSEASGCRLYVPSTTPSLR